VINYANVSALTEIVWSFKLVTVVDAVIIYGVHILYSHRIWILSRGRPRTLPVIVGIGLIVTLGVVIASIWTIYQCHVFTDLYTFAWAIYMVFSTMALNDFVIASSLCYLLATSRTAFSSTDSFLTKLMAYTINAGCLTSVISIVALIVRAVMPKNFIPLTFDILIAKLYVNSYIALLNTRYYLQPSDSDNVGNSEFRANHLSPHSRQSEAKKLQESGKNVTVFTHPHGHDEYSPIRPVQAVVRPIVLTMDMGAFSSA